MSEGTLSCETSTYSFLLPAMYGQGVELHTEAGR